jgi:hypothetical protein
MAYKGPYLGVRMVDGSTHNLPGRMGDVSPLLEAEGPLVRTEDVYGNDLLINTPHILDAQEYPAHQFGDSA